MFYVDLDLAVDNGEPYKGITMEFLQSYGGADNYRVRHESREVLMEFIKLHYEQEPELADETIRTQIFKED